MENIKKYIMIRFGELNTKGKNKRDFVSRLYLNIKNATRDYDVFLETRFDHIYISLNNEEFYDEIVDTLKNISGIYSFSPVYRLQTIELSEIVEFCRDYVSKLPGKTFKVICKRAEKNYPYRSDDIVRAVASRILKSTELKVDVHNPDIPLYINVAFDGVYIYSEKILGVGGYPLGTIGKGLMMISGGIDSPVAAYLMLKRGVALEFIHFASPPYTQDAVIEKIKDLLSVLNKFQPRIKLNVFPFTKIQEAIYQNTDESYCITIMRRMMYKIANRLCCRNDLKIICNGESIGQVASQTLDSMNVITKNLDFNVIRPLATFDKLDIVDIAKKIGTYDISIRPYEDCCTIFTPKAPKTKPHLDKVLEYEAKVNYDELIDEAFKNIEKIIIEKEDFEI